jgi:hypothetical protein
VPFSPTERQAAGPTAQNVTEAPEAAPAAPFARILHLQQTIGNGAVARMVASGALLQREGGAERELDKKWTVGASAVDKEMAEKVLGLKTIQMTFFVRYVGGKNPVNDAEFVGASADFAKTYKTLGVAGNDKEGAKLSFGQAIEVASRDEVTQAVTSVHQTVHRLAQLRAAPEEGAPPLSAPPQIETIAIFAHGESDGLGIDPNNANYTKAAQLKSFVGAIRPHVAGNVRFLLYACSAGGQSKEKEGAADPKAPGGSGSFAQLLAKELGGEAMVFAHNVAGHTESNPLARMFTADSAEGRSMFDVLYGASFAASEVARLRASKQALVEKIPDDKLAEKVKSAMWSHYVDAVATDFFRINSKSRHFDKGGYGGIGAAMFMDPEGTGKLLREDFQSTWLDDATIGNDFKRPAAANR